MMWWSCVRTRRALAVSCCRRPRAARGCGHSSRQGSPGSAAPGPCCRAPPDGRPRRACLPQPGHLSQATPACRVLQAGWPWPLGLSTVCGTTASWWQLRSPRTAAWTSPCAWTSSPTRWDCAGQPPPARLHVQHTTRQTGSLPQPVAAVLGRPPLVVLRRSSVQAAGSLTWPGPAAAAPACAAAQAVHCLRHTRTGDAQAALPDAGAAGQRPGTAVPPGGPPHARGLPGRGAQVFQQPAAVAAAQQGPGCLPGMPPGCLHSAWQHCMLARQAWGCPLSRAMTSLHTLPPRSDAWPHHTLVLAARRGLDTDACTGGGCQQGAGLPGHGSHTRASRHWKDHSGRGTHPAGGLTGAQGTPALIVANCQAAAQRVQGLHCSTHTGKRAQLSQQAHRQAGPAHEAVLSCRGSRCWRRQRPTWQWTTSRGAWALLCRWGASCVWVTWPGSCLRQGPPPAHWLCRWMGAACAGALPAAKPCSAVSHALVGKGPPWCSRAASC